MILIYITDLKMIRVELIMILKHMATDFSLYTHVFNAALNTLHACI